MITYFIYINSGVGVIDGQKKGRSDLNVALLDQFVCVIPGLMFEKCKTLPVEAGTGITAGKQGSTSENLVSIFLVITTKIRE